MKQVKSDPDAFAQQLRNVRREVDPRQPISRVQTGEAIRRHALARSRSTAMLVTLFAAAALFITAAVLVVVAALARVIPARRAAAIEPMRALRAD
jgi:cell division protein FtsX